MKAWLVTWEWTGEHAKIENKIAAVLNSRIHGSSVREIVELMYVNATYNVPEKIAYAQSKKKNPYPAQFVTINKIPWEGQIVCGHNPWLEARQVTNLQSRMDEDGKEITTWDEIPKPNIKFPR